MNKSDCEHIREFGKIERIILKSYIEGRLVSTSFEMKYFCPEKSKLTQEKKQYEFYGEIPKEFIGQEAMYFYIRQENNNSISERATIEIGKIKPRGENTYDIVSNENRELHVPREIRSQFNYKLRK